MKLAPVQSHSPISRIQDDPPPRKGDIACGCERNAPSSGITAQTRNGHYTAFAQRRLARHEL